eukprot:SAG31_NODE_13135_length_890_cov_5.208597_2_plen_54_part_01
MAGAGASVILTEASEPLEAAPLGLCGDSDSNSATSPAGVSPAGAPASLPVASLG